MNTYETMRDIETAIIDAIRAADDVTIPDDSIYHVVRATQSDPAIVISTDIDGAEGSVCAPMPSLFTYRTTVQVIGHTPDYVARNGCGVVDAVVSIESREIEIVFESITSGYDADQQMFFYEISLRCKHA